MGTYIGQKSPGNIPEIFVGIISTDLEETLCIFTFEEDIIDQYFRIENGEWKAGHVKVYIAI